MVFNTYTIPLIVSSIFLLGISAWSWRYQSTKSAKYLALLILCCAIYSLGYAFEISSPELEKVFFWLRFEYVGISGLPAFLILFAVYYAYPDITLSRRIITILYIIPVLTFIIILTNDYHNLYYKAAQMSTVSPFPVIVFEKGIWYWVNSAYIFFALLLSNVLFTLLLFKTARAYRSQIILLLTGSLIPWVAFVFYQLKIIPWNLDLSPYAFTLSGLFIFWGLIHHRLLDLLPVARTALFEKLPDGVIVLDSQLRIADLNSVAKYYLQINTSVLGKPAAEIIPNWDELVALYHETVPQANLEIEHVIHTKKYWIQVEAFPLEDRYGLTTGQMILLRDITERKQVEEKLHILATTDELTGLWNRRYLMKALTIELGRANRYQQFFSLLMFDIDHFKGINDYYGHAAGDEVLRQLASQLKDRLRKTDILSRLGGEEFCLLLPGTSLVAAIELAENLRTIIANTPVLYNGQKILITVSIGVTTYQEETDLDTILKIADDALYEAKNSGRNSIVIKTTTEPVVAGT